AGAAALAALLLTRVTRDARVGLVGALVFALHPVQSEAIAAASYQTTLLSGLLALGALALFGRGAAIGAIVASALALLAKEDAVGVPLLAATWALLSPPYARRRALAIAGGMAAAVALALVWRARVVSPSGVTYFGNAPRATIVWTMLRVVGLYGQLWLAP